MIKCSGKVTTSGDGYTLSEQKGCEGGTEVQLMSLPPESFRGKADGSKYGMHWPYITNQNGNGCSLFDTSILAWEFLKAHRSDATTQQITGTQCGNTCTRQCNKGGGSAQFCASGQSINPNKKYQNYRFNLYCLMGHYGVCFACHITEAFRRHK